MRRVMTKVRGTTEKLCTYCEVWYPLNRFTTHPAGRLGRDNRCNLCRAGLRPSRAKGTRHERTP